MNDKVATNGTDLYSHLVLLRDVSISELQTGGLSVVVF